MYIYATCACVEHRCQKETSSSVKLKVQMVVRHDVGAGIKPRFPARAASLVNHYAIPLIPVALILN